MEWSYALEECHGKTIGKDGYYVHRDSTRDGRTLAGLTYVRGLFAHSLTQVGEALTARPPPRVVGLVGGRRGGSVTILTGLTVEYR